MNFLRWSEIIFLLVAVVFLITQVAWPLVRGTKLFPIFRREAELEKKLDDKRQNDLEQGLERELGQGKKRHGRGANQRNSTQSKGEGNV